MNSFLTLLSLFSIPFIQLQGDVYDFSLIVESIRSHNVRHVETPESVKSVYFTSSALGYAPKKDNLDYLLENKEINSVTIDIKTVSGYLNFDLGEKYFGDIKPVSNDSIPNIKEVIEELHKKDIYVIGRVVVFKDKLLAKNRPDLAILTADKSRIWTDYKGIKYLDPYSEEVWNYNANIAEAAYYLGFDEINFDYVRFPTDGRISDTYYPFSQEVKEEYPKWGTVKVIDSFAEHISSRLENRVPELVISADIFGLVTNTTLFQIGQNLESFLLYFDYLGPMIYPSHYGEGYLGFIQPDNHPYEIFDDSLQKASQKIEALNQEVQNANIENRRIRIGNTFDAALDINKISSVDMNKIRPWIQGFGCTRCRGATPYNREKFRKQIQAIEKYGIKSWWVWSAGSNYYEEWYD